MSLTETYRLRQVISSWCIVIIPHPIVFNMIDTTHGIRDENVTEDSPNPNNTPTGYIFHGRSTNWTTGPMIFIINVLWWLSSSSSLRSSSSGSLFAAARLARAFLICYEYRASVSKGRSEIRKRKRKRMKDIPFAVSREFCRGWCCSRGRQWRGSWH